MRRHIRARYRSIYYKYNNNIFRIVLVLNYSYFSFARLCCIFLNLSCMSSLLASIQNWACNHFTKRFELLLLLINQLLYLSWYLLLMLLEWLKRVIVNSDIWRIIFWWYAGTLEFSIHYFLNINSLEEFVLQNLFCVILGAKSLLRVPIE